MRSSWGAAWRVARGLALSGSSRQRWRQVSLVSSSVVATVALLVGVMMVWQVVLADAHLEARQPQRSGPAVASWQTTMPIVPGGVGQIPVQWIEPDPGHEGDPALVPPGLDRLPGPGEAVVSPGLVRQGLSAEDLGLRSSTAGSGQGGVIGDDFLISRSEGYAIARPPQGQHLPKDYRDRISGYQLSGSLAGFAETTLDVPAGRPGLMTTLVLLVLPALLLLASATRGVSGVTEQRAARLWSLGVGRRDIRRVVGLEVAVLVAIGALAGTALWVALLSHRTQWPGNDAVLLPSARGQWWMPFLVVPLVVVVATTCAMTSRIVPVSLRRRVRLGTWAVLPLAVGLAAMALAAPLPRWWGAKNADLSMLILMMGTVLVIVGLPLGLPVLSRWTARLFIGSKDPTRWLAARRLGGGSGRLARAGAFVGILVFIVGAEVTLYEGARPAPAFSVGGGTTKVWSAYWGDAPEGFARTVQQRATQVGGAAEPLRRGGRDGGGLVFRDCASAEAFFGMPVPVRECSGARTPEARTVARITSVVVGDAEASRPADFMYVSGPLDWDGADALRLFQGSTAPVLMQVLGPDTDFLHPGKDWMRTSVLGASALLLLGLFRVLGDRAVESASEHRALEAAGLLPQEAARTTLVATLLPVVLAVPIGMVAAWLFAFVGASAQYTTENYLLITMATLAVAACCTGVVLGALFWQRRVGD